MTYDFDWYSLLKKSECKSRYSGQSKSIQLSSIDGWTSETLPKLVIIWTFDKVKSDKFVDSDDDDDEFIKADLAKNLSIKTGLSFNYSKKIIDDIIHIILSNLKKGNLSLKNVGSFKKITKKERMGRNPKTKEEFIISSRKSITFKPSNKIKIYSD